MFNYLNARGDDLRYGKITAHVFIALFAVIILLGSFGTVSAQEIGVKTRLGQIVSVVEPGFYVKMPFIEHVAILDMRVQTVDYDKNGKEGDAVDTSSLSASSKDLQTVWANIVVNYRLNPANATEIYVQYRNTDVFGASVVEPIIRETVKAITAEYSAEELVTKRQEVSDRVYAALNEKLPEKGVILTQSNLTDFQYSEAFSNAIDAKVTAVQNAEAAKNRLVQVQAEADQKVVTAKADAEAIQIQAQAINSQGGADYVMLQAINKWNGQLPAQYIPGSANPFIGVLK